MHSDSPPICQTCGRETALTFHHLIPKKLHRRSMFRQSFSRDELNQGIRVCRLCHNGIHKRYDEMTLAKRFATLDALLADEGLQNHFQWVSKQQAGRRRR